MVGEDGETHQGIFDAAFLNTVPNCTVFSPAYYDELRQDLHTALYECEGVAAVRYPRGGQLFRPFDYQPGGKPFDLYGAEAAEIVLVTYGRLFSFACEALSNLRKEGIPLRIVKLNRIKPVSGGAVEAAKGAKHVFFFEEGMQQGGVGEHFEHLLHEAGFTGRYVLRAIERFVPHATMMESLHDLGLDAAGMCRTIVDEVQNWS